MTEALREIFVFLFTQASAVTWMILFVWVLRHLFKKAPSWIFCVLWGLCALRLLLVSVPEAPFSVFSTGVVLNGGMLSGEELTQLTAAGENAGPALAAATAAAASSASGAGADFMNRYIHLLCWIWLAGCFFFVGLGLVYWIRLKLALRTAIRSKDGYWISDESGVPFVCGVIRPKIYISAASPADDLPWILAHEKAHIARKDPLWKLLGYGFVCVFWMDPLIWLAWFSSEKDMEKAADEKAAGNLSLSEKKRYCQALVHAGTARRKVLICPVCFGETGVKNRILNLLQVEKGLSWIAAVAVITAIALLLGLADNPQNLTAEESPSFYANNREVFLENELYIKFD